MRKKLIAPAIAALIASAVVALAQSGVPISSLPSVPTLTGAEYIPVVRGGVTYKATPAQVRAITSGPVNGTWTGSSIGQAYGGAGTISGILKGSGTGTVSQAVAGTDYAPATATTSILAGSGSGGFSGVTIGAGLSYSAGTLSSTGISAGTSGGIPYFNSPSTVASSAQLGAGLVVLGGGAGTAPATTATATGFVTWLGTPNSANLRAVLTDETGTGAAVFAGSPTLTGTPYISTNTGTALNIGSGNGYVMLADRVSATESSTTFGIGYSDAGPYFGYGVASVAAGNVSSYASSLPRGLMKTQNVAGFTFYWGAAQSVAVGSAVTMTQIASINGSGLNVTAIGAATPGTGAFTTLTTNNSADFAGARISGSAVPVSGAGVETLYTAGTGYVQAYNRTGTAYLPLVLAGNSVSVAAQGGASITASSGGVTISNITGSTQCVQANSSGVLSGFGGGCGGSSYPFRAYRGTSNQTGIASGVATAIVFNTVTGTGYDPSSLFTIATGTATVNATGTWHFDASVTISGNFTGTDPAYLTLIVNGASTSLSRCYSIPPAGAPSTGYVNCSADVRLTSGDTVRWGVAATTTAAATFSVVSSTGTDSWFNGHYVGP